MKSPLIVDVETVGPAKGGGRVVTVSWKVLGDRETRVEAVGHQERAAPFPDPLLEMLADPERPFVSQTKYDARFLRLAHGLEVTGPFYDTQVMAWILNENQSLSLDSLARRYLNLVMDKRIKVRGGLVFFACDDGKLVPVDEAPLDQLESYNIRDVDAEADLFEELWERLRAEGWLDYFLTEAVPYTECLLDMECRGIPYDVDRGEVFRQELEVQHDEMVTSLMRDANLPDTFNLNSGPMMAAFLFNPLFEMKDALPCVPGEYNGMSADLKVETCQYVVDLLGLPFTVGTVGRSYIHGVWTLPGRGLRGGPRTPKGDRFATSRPALKVNLATASDPWCQKFLEFRSVNTLLTTYLRKFPLVQVDGRIYGRFNQTGTKTGRLSSSEPNLQNVPSHGDLGPRTRDLFRVTT